MNKHAFNHRRPLQKSSNSSTRRAERSRMFKPYLDGCHQIKIAARLLVKTDSIVGHVNPFVDGYKNIAPFLSTTTLHCSCQPQLCTNTVLFPAGWPLSSLFSTTISRPVWFDQKRKFVLLSVLRTDGPLVKKQCACPVSLYPLQSAMVSPELIPLWPT